MKSILIIKTSAIGDVIQAFPVVQDLKAEFPNAQIDWVCEKQVESLVRAHPQIDNVIVLDSKKWKKSLFSKCFLSEVISFIRNLRKKHYSVIFDLQGNTKSGLITFFCKAADKVGFDRSSVAEWPNLVFTNKKYPSLKKSGALDAYRGLICSYLNKLPFFTSSALELKMEDIERQKLEEQISEYKKKYPYTIVLGFGSNWENKKLSITTLASFIRQIQGEHKIGIIVPFLAKEEAEKKLLEKEFEGLFFKNISLSGCYYLIKNSDAFIGVDSALLHLAQLSGKPIFAIFGPSLATYYLDKKHHSYSIQGTCPYNETFVKRCKRLRTCDNAPCMKGLGAPDLLKKFNEFWSKK